MPVAAAVVRVTERRSRQFAPLAVPADLHRSCFGCPNRLHEFEEIDILQSAFPALGPREHTLGIKRDGDRYSIFYVAPEKLIGSDHASARDVPKTACETPIERFVAEDLRTIWKRMVMAVRYPDAVTVGLDGTRYHFSVHVYGNVSYGGQIWSPPEHTLTGKLVALSDLMRDYCLHDGAERLRYRARMSRETTALLRSLPR